MPPTMTVPIRETRINNTIFVGGPGARTIQAAIAAASEEGGIFVVLIPHDYAGSDTIASLVGTANILISDLRGNNAQSYVWNGAAYVPAVFAQLGGITAPSLAVSSLSGDSLTLSDFLTVEGNAGIAGTLFTDGVFTANAGATVVGVLTAESKVVLQTLPQTTVLSLDTLDVPNRISRFISQTNIAANGGGFQFDSFNVDDSRGATILQLLDNGAALGYDVNVYAHLNVQGTCAVSGRVEVYELNVDTDADVAGFLNVHGNFQAFTDATIGGNASILGNCGIIGALSVDGPTQLGGGITGPVEVNGDLAVSGDLSAATGEIAGSPIRTFENSPDGPGGMEWPPIGIGVSTGTAWGASIDPATVPRTNVANTFTADQTVVGSITAGLALRVGNPTSTKMNLNVSGDFSLIDAYGVDPATNGSLFIRSLRSDGTSLVNVLAIDGDGNTNINGNLHLLSGNVGITGTPSGWQLAPTLASNIIVGGFGNGGVYFNWYGGTSGVHFMDGTGGGGTVGSVDSGGNASFSGGLGVTAYGDFSQNIVIGDGGTRQTAMGRLSWNSDATFLDSIGSGSPRGTFHFRIASSAYANLLDALAIDVSGNVHVAGDISAGSKSFKIAHPLDDTKTLTHGCVEGPEHAVFYRGEATTKKGSAVVTLPNYFEALTEEDGRTVQLTQVAEPEGSKFSPIATSRVADGKFKILSVEPSVTVYWEVKAIRRDAKIEVVSERKAA